MGLHGRGGEREEEDETCHEKWVERTTERLPFRCATGKWACGSGLEDRFLSDDWVPLLLLSNPGDAVTSHTCLMN